MIALGEIRVDLYYGTTVLGPYHAEFQEMGTHEVHVTYAPEPSTNIFNRSYIWNQTSVPWLGFQIAISDADFAGWDFGAPMQARAVSPVVDIGKGGSIVLLNSLEVDEIALDHLPRSDFSLLGSAVARLNDQGTGFRDSVLTLSFGEPVDSGEGFALYHSIIPSPGAAGSAEFKTFYTPLPEPAAGLLLAFATIPILVLRRKWR